MPIETGYSMDAISAMLMFSLASSSLLLINKIVLHMIPMPSLVSSLQFFCATITALVLMLTGRVPRDRYEWPKVRPYLYYIAMFVATIYCNMKALQHSNVETIIVFRACCPVVVCVIEAVFMGRHFPSFRSVLSLAVLVLGAAGYVLTDRAFRCNVMEHAWPR